MSEDSSAKYYQDNKKKRQKNFVKDIKVFLKKKERKKQNYGCKLYKNLPKDENKYMCIYIYLYKLFLFRKFYLLSPSIFERM